MLIVEHGGRIEWKRTDNLSIDRCRLAGRGRERKRRSLINVNKSSERFTQDKAGTGRRADARGRQQQRVIPDESAVVGGNCAHRYGEQSHADRRDDRLDLHQGDVADDHLDGFPDVVHVAQVRLRAQPRRQAHVEITLQAKQRRH